MNARIFLNGILYGWHGNYQTWQEAQSKCSGYDSEIILEKVIQSALKVKNGEAAYERDSVIFNEVQLSFPLLSSLLFIAASNGGTLNIIDFGGSLGTTYYQNRKFLDRIKEVNWCIVEQPGFVKAGKKFFEDGRIRFFNNIDECLANHKIDAILFSSVLQYLEEPWNELDKVISKGIRFIIFDRTPFVTGRERITVQRVNPRIYNASYPCRFFNQADFLDKMKRSYHLITEWSALDKANISSEYKGYLFQNQNQP